MEIHELKLIMNSRKLNLCVSLFCSFNFWLLDVGSKPHPTGMCVMEENVASCDSDKGTMVDFILY